MVEHFRPLNSTKDTRRLLSIGKTKLHELIKQRHLHSVLIGHKRLIVGESIEAYLKSLTKDRP